MAFQVRLRLRELGASPADKDILPILWSDNYIILLPGESRVLTATVPSVSVVPGNPDVVVEVYNNKVVCEK